MLSILIPVYNHSVVSLVYTLRQQAEELKVPYEIIVCDDCSTQYLSENKMLTTLSSVQYFEEQKHRGRTGIRNYLISKAHYPNLLFIDCDAIISNNTYIETYKPFLNTHTVICGGTAYSSTKPDRLHKLRWKYGISHEMVSAEKRNTFPYRYFSCFNVLIPQEVFSTISFDESIIDYGHEDTVLGYNLQKQKVPIIHIENALIHTGIDTNKDYIIKTIQAIKNLCMISMKYPDIQENILLFKKYECIKKAHIHNAFAHIYSLLNKPFSAIIEKTAHPSLLQVYKIICFCYYKTINRNNNETDNL